MQIVVKALTDKTITLDTSRTGASWDENAEAIENEVHDLEAPSFDDRGAVGQKLMFH